jgi:hypothetical protein
MSADAAKGPGFFGRSASRRSLLLMVAALIVVIAVIVVVVVLVDRSNDQSRRAALADDTEATAVTSPYDMTELTGDTNLNVVSKAAFISILVPNDSGTLTSYGVSSDLAAAQALSQAIAGAEEVDAQLAASMTSTTGAGGASTITFVLASRETLTFTLAIDQGLIARSGKAWRPDGDLTALVQAAIKAPQ